MAGAATEGDDARLGRIRDAFTRQAESFARHAAIADVSVEDRFRRALGPAGKGRVLDVACGPGVVTAAVAADATEAVGLDATEAMLAKARETAAKAGRTNVRFEVGDAEALPFADAGFDAVVTRLAIHHFARPDRALAEMHRVLKPGGRLVVVDVVSSDDPENAALHNAIEILRDPSHVRMLPAEELDAAIAAAGFKDLATETWDKDRAFGEWMGIVNDPGLNAPLGVVVRALAERGADAGIGLRLEAGEVRFFHRWRLVAANR